MIGAKVSTSRVRLRAGISVVDARANVTYVIPAPAISYVLLKVEPSLDVLNKNPYVGETQVVLDSTALAIAKRASDSVLSTDAVTSKIFGLGKYDSVSTADVVSVLLIFIRNFADTANVSDAVAYSYLKNLFEAVAASDDIQSQDFSKFIPDGVAMQDGADVTDGNQHHFEKGIMNMAFATDANQIYIERTSSDSVNMLDAKAIAFSRTLLDAFGFTDAQTFIVEMAKADAATVSESLATAFSKLISADSIAFSDQIVKNPGKGLSDSAAPDDTGWLYAQNYCDITYFLEDYVGEYRTFT
jgi:hypothetical protein